MSRIAASNRIARSNRTAVSNRTTVPSQQNLIKSSEDVTTANWTFNNADVVTSGFSDPLGGTGAQRIVCVASNVFHQFFPGTNAVAADGQLTTSLWLKANSTAVNWINLGVNNGGQTVIYDPVSGTFKSGFSSGLTGTAESWGNGWYRVALTYVAVNNTSERYFFYSDASSSTSVFTGDGIKGCIFFGGQRNRGNRAGPYKKTTTSIFDSGNIRNKP